MNRKKIQIFVALLVLFLVTVACGTIPSAPDTQSVATSVPTLTPEPTTVAELPIVAQEAEEESCPTMEVQEFTSPVSFSEMVKSATGSYPGADNDCWAIFNSVHRAWTNWAWIKNGQALLNLPVQIISPSDADHYLIGSPDLLDDRVVVDQDTIVIDGGVTNVTQGGVYLQILDWSTVKGGIYVNEVRFESDRLAFDENHNRFWTGYCKGEVFDNEHLYDALACGLGN